MFTCWRHGAVLWLALVVGCDSRTQLSDAAPADAVDMVDSTTQVPPPATPEVDLLLVIDNSGSMAEEQTYLVQSLSTLFLRIEEQMGEVPDLHVGIISTDLGIAPYATTGCTGKGDDGMLLNTPRTTSCTAPTERYVVDRPDGTGGRTTNYSASSLSEQISCMAQLGIDGCGFERTLAATRRALDGSQPENAGFVRDAALLVVLFLTDEDDCSADDLTLYSESETALGPYTSFRCFEYGIVCSPDEPRTPGAKSDCRPRDDSAYLEPVADYVDFFSNLKPPGKLLVAALTGDDAPVVVEFSVDAYLGPSCSTDLAEGTPALRMGRLINQLGDIALRRSICSDGYGGMMTDIADAIASRF